MRKSSILILAVTMSMAMIGIGSCNNAAENTEAQVIEISAYGAKSDTVTNNAEAINKAIAEAPHGAVVKIPAGRYMTGTIHLKSNVTLMLDEGAELIGSNNLDDYDNYQPTRDMSRYDTGEGTRNANLASDERWTKALILGVGVENAVVCGKGTINGRHVVDSLGEESMRGPHTIIIAESKNVKLEGLHIKCSSNYAVLGYELVNSEISGLSIDEGWDGVHIRGCENVVIKDCDIRTGDDAIAGGYWKGMKIDNCRLNSSCNGIRMIEPSENLEIGNCHIYGPGVYPHRTSGAEKRTGTIYGIVLEPGAWGDAPGHTENVYIHDVTIDNLLSPVVYSMGENNTCSGLTIENLVATHISYNTTPLNRQDCVRMWDNITIKNMRISQGE